MRAEPSGRNAVAEPSCPKPVLLGSACPNAHFEPTRWKIVGPTTIEAESLENAKAQNCDPEVGQGSCSTGDHRPPVRVWTTTA